MVIYAASPANLGRRTMPSRIYLETRDDVQIWEGRCEGCVTVTRIVFDESVGRYLCSNCLQQKEKEESGLGAFRLDPAQPYPFTVNGHSKATTVSPTNKLTQRYV